jgi:hypothetical protein
MSPNRACWRRAAVGAVVCLCALTSPITYADTIPSVPSLSGTVYLDANRNSMLDTGDWAIVGAKVHLRNAKDPNFLLSVVSDNNGRYIFDGPSADVHTGLPAGTYSIQMGCPATPHGVDTKGQLVDLQTGLAVYPQDWGDAPQQNDTFTNIKLQSTTRGVDYNFGEFIYPIELVSKQMLITTDSNNSVPEPSVLALLAGGAILVGVRINRRRKRLSQRT